MQLYLFPKLTDDSTPDEPEAATEKLHIHALLSSLNLQVSDARIQLDESSYIRVNRFNTKLSDDGLLDYTGIEQDIDFSIDYVGQNAQQLNIQGAIESRINAGVSTLDLSIARIHLASMLNPNETLGAPPTDKQSNAPQSAIDWQWLSLFKPVELSLNVGKITLTGSLEPIFGRSMGADLRGQMELATSLLKLKLDGEININGADNNKLSVTLESPELPVKSSLDQQTLALINQYFPVKAEIDVEQTDGFVNLHINNVQLGDSDIKGSVALNPETTDLITIKTALTSQRVSFKTPTDQPSDAATHTT
jgi:hypothetical protein